MQCMIPAWGSNEVLSTNPPKFLKNTWWPPTVKRSSVLLGRRVFFEKSLILCGKLDLYHTVHMCPRYIWITKLTSQITSKWETIFCYPFITSCKTSDAIFIKICRTFCTQSREKIKTSFLKWNFYWLKIGLTRRIHQEAIPKRGNCVNNTENRLQGWQYGKWISNRFWFC